VHDHTILNCSPPIANAILLQSKDALPQPPTAPPEFKEKISFSFNFLQHARIFHLRANNLYSTRGQYRNNMHKAALQELTAISPLDGRYWARVAPLADFFSEYALHKYRVPHLQPIRRIAI
jgi:hypothetical protein